MNISNSLAIQQPADQDISRLKEPSRPASISDRRKFEFAVASAEKEVKPAQKEAETDSNAAATKKGGPAPHRKTDKSKYDIAVVPTIVPVPTIASVLTPNPALNAHTDASAITSEQPSALVDAKALDSATAVASTALGSQTVSMPAHDVAANTFNVFPGEAIDQTQGETAEGANSAETMASPTAIIDSEVVDKTLPKESAASANETNAATPEGETATGQLTGAPQSMEQTSEKTTDVSQNGQTNSAGPVNQMKPVVQTAAIAAPLQSSDLQTMADAFEASVRSFERAGAHWVGSAQITLQSSALKGAAFQLVSDGQSLSILLTEFASAPVPISRRQESQLSDILTRKLGRNVSLNLNPSEIESVEHAEPQYE